jgi:hypothetical protein
MRPANSRASPNQTRARLAETGGVLEIVLSIEA